MERPVLRLAADTGAWLRPSHDFPFYRSLPPFPQALE